jgi:hypothetical protein
MNLCGWSQIELTQLISSHLALAVHLRKIIPGRVGRLEIFLIENLS